MAAYIGRNLHSLCDKMVQAKVKQGQPKQPFIDAVRQAQGDTTASAESARRAVRAFYNRAVRETPDKLLEQVKEEILATVKDGGSSIKLTFGYTLHGRFYDVMFPEFPEHWDERTRDYFHENSLPSTKDYLKIARTMAAKLNKEGLKAVVSKEDGDYDGIPLEYVCLQISW